MTTKTIVCDLNHDDLVNFFSTASYGSNWLTFGKNGKDYYGTELEDKKDCVEDTWAKVLLSGKSIYMADCYAEDETEFYGDKPHEWKNNGHRGYMRYTLCLDDIKTGLERAIDGTYNHDEDDDVSYVKDAAFRFINDDSEFDICDAEVIMQIVCFNEVVYG